MTSRTREREQERARESKREQERARERAREREQERARESKREQVTIQTEFGWNDINHLAFLSRKKKSRDAPSENLGDGLVDIFFKLEYVNLYE